MHSSIFAGVDIICSPGRLRRAFVYAALDADRELLALAHGDWDEVLAYFGGQAGAYVAINAPHHPNLGTASELIRAQSEFPYGESLSARGVRLCEHLLQAQGLRLDSTPKTRKDCPGWMQKGFSLYEQLEDFGYHTYPNSESAHLLFETHSEGVFWRLLRQKAPLPNSLEGRLQRQLLLHSIEMPVPDAMDFFLEITRFKLMQGELPDEDLHSYEELNALAAAHMAWQAAHHPDLIDLVGDPDGDQIALPNLP